LDSPLHLPPGWKWQTEWGAAAWESTSTGRRRRWTRTNSRASSDWVLLHQKEVCFLFLFCFFSSSSFCFL
jgi:hypothetical protein